MTISQGGRSPWDYNAPDTMSVMRFVPVRPHHVAWKPVPVPVKAVPIRGTVFPSEGRASLPCRPPEGRSARQGGRLREHLAA